MRHGRGVKALWGIAVLAGTVWACETTRNPGGIQRDLIAPQITLTNTTGSDTEDIAAGLRFQIDASDNLSLKTIRLTYTGGYIAGPVDSNFTAQTQRVSIQKTVVFPKNSGAGGNVRIVGRAIDGAGNASEDTLFIFLANVQALQVILVAPSSGAVASSGKYVPIDVIAVQASGVRRVGWLIAPAGQVALAADSVSNANPPFPDSIEFKDSVLVTGTTGTFTVVGFAVDSGNRVGTSTQATVTIQSAANDLTPPQVAHVVANRVEVKDSITVHATDPSGITVLGFEVRNLAGTLIRKDSLTFGGTTTDIVRTFSMHLDQIGGVDTIGTFPKQVVVNGFATDGAAAKNRGVSTVGFVAGGTPLTDTITVVAGITHPLPLGGRIMDAAVDSTRNEVYLTNIALSRLEVFGLAQDSFVAQIPVGSSPWGIALWPKDTLGHYADTVVVANSGGTNLSIVDVAARRERRRHRLPNFEVDQVNTEIKNGIIHVKITPHDFSDRPQYVSMVCRHDGTGACFPDSIIAVYSTTPTIAQENQPNRGTIRWENLTSATPESHFFWEHATAEADPDATDTLMVIADRPWLTGVGANDTLVCPVAGEIVFFDNIPFADTTFVRNSGDFTHAFMGEGENVGSRFARALNYSASAGLVNRTDTDTISGVVFSCPTQIDRGVSPGIRVSDFISNTATKVTGIAVNFNGHTNVVRTTDSIYALDVGLRLGGTMAGSGANPGMDFHPDNDFDPFVGGTPFYGGGDNPNNRLVFSARVDGGIDVWDTYNFARVTTVPIRDPVIGPLRVAKGPGGTLILVGVTVRGVVTVRLPAIVNIFPSIYRGVNATR